MRRDFDKISNDELSQLQKEVEKVESDKFVRQHRYQVKLRQQEQQNEEFDKEL